MADIWTGRTIGSWGCRVRCSIHFVSEIRETQEVKCVSGSVQGSMQPRPLSPWSVAGLCRLQPVGLGQPFGQPLFRKTHKSLKSGPSHIASSGAGVLKILKGLWCRGTESNCRHQPFQGVRKTKKIQEMRRMRRDKCNKSCSIRSNSYKVRCHLILSYSKSSLERWAWTALVCSVLGAAW